MTDERLDQVSNYRDELWPTMVRDIRVQLRRAEANGVLSEPFLDEPLRNEMTLTCAGGYISVWLHPETGEGSWNQLLPVDRCELWFVCLNGDVEIDGNMMNISATAKWFVDRLTAK